MTTPAPKKSEAGSFRAPVSRRSNIAPFLALDVMTEARRLEREGRDIIHLEIGEPSSPPPRAIREAAKAALEGGPIGYTEALGRPSLRARIARHYREAYRVDVAPERIAVTTGSSAAFVLAFLALFDAGATVAVAAPGYPAYRNILAALGIETATIEAPEATGFVLTAAMVEAAHAKQRFDGLLLMSPANPTGAMIKGEALREICAACDRLGVAFISDEIYHGLTYEGPAHSALEYLANAIVANSFSKYFCMTGWRIGWLVLPEQLIRPVERLHQSLAISAPLLSQLGAEAAFDCRDELGAALAGYARNRAILLNELPSAGLGQFHAADGAFYLYVDVSRHTDDSPSFCRKMLSEIGVATTPGVDFDAARGNRWLRLSFAGAEADVVEAIRRMRNWLR